MFTSISYFQAFLIGSCIGSFLNVIVYRFPNDLSVVKPRSFCPNCKTKLTWKENIPLFSWFFQKGKCINCYLPISCKYPFVEFLTGILFVVFINSSPSSLNFNDNLIFNVFFSWLFLSLLICITLIDIECLWIPQGLINFGFISGVLGLVITASVNEKFIDLFFIIRCLSTSAISFLTFEFVRSLSKYFFKKDALGKGDSKLIAMLAIWLGPIGILFAVGISYIIAAIYCLVGLSTKLLKSRQVIPFAPFLSIGGLIIWFYGNDFLIEKMMSF